MKQFQSRAEWATFHEMQESKGRRCLHWLETGRCRGYREECIGTQLWGPDGWKDHRDAWNWNGKPAVLTAHPYGLRADTMRRLADIADDPRFVVFIWTGWYGYGSVGIEIWNAETRAEWSAQRKLAAG